MAQQEAHHQPGNIAQHVDQGGFLSFKSNGFQRRPRERRFKHQATSYLEPDLAITPYGVTQGRVRLTLMTMSDKSPFQSDQDLPTPSDAAIAGDVAVQHDRQAWRWVSDHLSR
jgi:hypothetical protein